MIAMTLAEIADVVGGTTHGDPDVPVTAEAFVDSRAVVPGGLFVAVVGERVDGHEYAATAHAAGAAAVLGSRPTDAPTVVVDDPVLALGRLARHVRDRLPDLAVLAMTGSQGKTGTKDYLAAILQGERATVATQGNLNNELGVPLTVLRATDDTRFLVVEMGARHVGNIAYLCGIARPDVAAVLNVGTAHLGEFGSREAIAQTKGEIVEALPATGTAVLAADDPVVAAMTSRTAARVLTFGAFGDVAWRVVDGEGARMSFLLGHDGAWASVVLAQPGAHQVVNATAAGAMALAVGVPLDDVAVGLTAARPASRWRMDVRERSDGVTVINDAYNANPDSMVAALDTLARMGRTGRRTLAVLGEMRELGDESDESHVLVGLSAAVAGIDVVVAVGPVAPLIADGAARSSSWNGELVPTAGRDEALAWLRDNVLPGDVVLVKASRGVALEHIADGLLDPTTDEGADRG
jgi:UDP-N-acetylmuramoyl-tripeptide--D-alanyl-D-alanine ligase